VLLAILLALLQGGSLRHIATLPVRSMPLIVASLAIQVVIYFPGLRDSALARQGGAAIYIGALTLVLMGVVGNRHLGKAVWVVLAGLVLNMVVIVANGGHMPTNAAAMRSVRGSAQVQMLAAHRQYANVQLANRSSRLLPLSDIFPLPMPFGHGNVFSVGDILIVAGAAGLAYSATRRPWNRAATPRSAATVGAATQQLAAG
jgi:hypothetical protein